LVQRAQLSTVRRESAGGENGDAPRRRAAVSHAEHRDARASASVVPRRRCLGDDDGRRTTSTLG
jgi:hypothetical protein